jgi:hypothetical protein
LTERTGQPGLLQDSRSRYVRGNLLEQFEPLRADAILKQRKTGDVAPGFRQAFNKAEGHRIAGDRKNDGYCVGHLLQRPDR